MYMVQHSLQMFQFKIYPDKKLHMAQTVCERERERWKGTRERKNTNEIEWRDICKIVDNYSVL